MPAVSPGLGASGHTSHSSIDDYRRPSLPARPERAPARVAIATGNTSTSAPATAPGSGLASKSASANTSAHGHSLPASRAEPEATEVMAETNGNGHGHKASGDLNLKAYSNVMRRPSKNLPQPPIGPVMPDFEDLVHARRGSASNYLAAEVAPEAGIKRKTSVVKKIKERVTK